MVTRISDDYEPQFPVVGEDLPSLGGTRMDDDCRLQADSLNDVLSVEAWVAENRHETFPVGMDKTAVEPLCLPVVVQTRLQVGCDPDLPLPVDKAKELLVEDGPDVIFSGWKLNVMSDVSREICVVPDEFLVVVAKKAVEPLVLPVVVMTRSQAGCAPALTLPVDEEKNSQVEDGPDMLSGCVMDMGDPDVERSNQVLLEVVPF